jgi:hypothetical protein
MDFPGEQLFAGTALTANEYGALPASDGTGQLAQPPHGRMLSHHQSVHIFLPPLQHGTPNKGHAGRVDLENFNRNHEFSYLNVKSLRGF